jgi:hypothetical protein
MGAYGKPLASPVADGKTAKSEKLCRYCYGTGIISCTTGWDGEMAVSCSCRHEKADIKRDDPLYVRA